MLRFRKHVQILLAIGTKLEHIITQSAHEITEQQLAIEGGLVVNPSDDHFWFHQPRIVLYLIHFIIFQNAFEIAIFFWIWVSNIKQLLGLYFFTFKFLQPIQKCELKQAEAAYVNVFNFAA